MLKESDNLISIDEVIFRAKSQGVDFGKGNPRERLRYLTKIGLLPHAKRKSFNNQPPNGAYPEYVIEILKEIDKKIKAGKSIQEIKKEKERKKLVEGSFPYYTSHPILDYTPHPILEFPQSKVELIKTEKEGEIKKDFFYGKIINVFKIIFLILAFSGMTYFLLTSQVGNRLKENLYSSLLASFSWIQKFAQAPPAPIEEKPKERENFLPFNFEPYLTINAETDINASLNVKKTITASDLTLIGGGFKATLASADLTADRIYTFPDLSGTVCLTTGNCFGIGGEVFSSGGVSNRLTKFITSREIGLSSINDFYLNGVVVTIDSAGELGIGIENPAYPLHVKGRIQATGDICTDLKGGKCLSELTAPSPPIFIGGGGIGGSGTSGYLPIWTSATALGNSIVSQSGSNLNVAGIVSMNGFRLGTSATSGYILTADDSGFGTWQPAPSGVLPSGENGQTLRYDGNNWVANSFLYNTGTALSIGTTSTLATLTLSGNAVFSSANLPQLFLKYDDNNYLKFSITSTSSEILASKTMTFNSLTGEIKFWDTSIKKGEYILRSSLPIFKFPVPAQTTSTTFVAVTKEISTSTLNNASPDPFPGSTRKIAFLLNFADDVPINASSTWLIDLDTGTDTEFYFAGQNLSSLTEGVSHMSEFYSLPEENWRLKVKVPSGNTIRVFNIFLLIFDQIQ